MCLDAFRGFQEKPRSLEQGVPMIRRVVAVVSLFVVAACGPSTDTFSCNNTTSKSCSTVSITGGTLTDKTCTGGSATIESCATAGIIGRCTLNGLFGGAACPSGATCSSNFVLYTGGDAAAAQASCTTLTGTWAAN